MVTFLEWLPRQSQLSKEQWADTLHSAAGELKGGSVGGPDQLPPELYRAGGWPCAQALVGVADTAFVHGVPDAWRGGRVAAVPKQAKQGLSLQNSRGTLRSDVYGKLYAKVIRKLVN